MTCAHKDEKGFSLIEAMIAMVLLVVGLTGLLGLFGFGIKHQQMEREDFIAKEKARECFESIYGARNAGQLTWDQVNNDGGGESGVFVTGFNPLLGPGPDGILGTVDDSGAETYTLPGPDGIFGTSDDVIVTLSNFTREVVVAPVVTNPTLKQITVTVRVSSATGQRDYIVVGFISEYH
jgi:prepilin-type N-terminal cleavage/methylation domain-containing protein